MEQYLISSAKELKETWKNVNIARPIDVVLQLEFTAVSLKEGMLVCFLEQGFVLYSLLINLLFSGYQVVRYLFDNYALKLLKFELCYDASFNKLYIFAIYT